LNKEELVEILKKVLKTDQDLSFLLRLSVDELKILVGCIRDRVDFSGTGRDN